MWINSRVLSGAGNRDELSRLADCVNDITEITKTINNYEYII